MISLAHIVELACLAIFVFAAKAIGEHIFDPRRVFRSSQEVIGLKKEWLAHTRVTLRSIFRTKSWASEGYEKFSRMNKLFMMPSIDRGHLVVIPTQQLKQVYGQPDSRLEMYETSLETLQMKHTISDPNVGLNPLQNNVVRNQLTRNLDILTPVLDEELKRGLGKYWSSGTEWQSVTLWPSCLKLIGAAANSLFCGQELCRNEEFLDRVETNSTSVFAGALFIHLTPAFIRPLVAYVVSLWCRYACNRAMAVLTPVVTERLAQTAQLRNDPKSGWTPPKDFMQWLIDDSYASNDPSQLTSERIGQRLLFLNLVSLHSTSFTLQNLILDLWSTDPSLGYVEAMRKECEMVLQDAGGVWTRTAVQKLVLVDSFVRESMRINPFAIIGLPRRVIDPNGLKIELPNGHTVVPKGQLITVPIEPAHLDESRYPDAHTFKPFRFADPKSIEKVVEALANDREPQAMDPKKFDQDITTPEVVSGVTLNDAFLGFGYGRHACPGRFFAINEAKLLIANILLDYDIEYLPSRPKPLDTLWMRIPLHGAQLRVRRRRV